MLYVCIFVFPSPCVFISVYFSFVTSLDSLVFVLCLLSFQIQFKTIDLFDLSISRLLHYSLCGMRMWKVGVPLHDMLLQYLPFIWRSSYCLCGLKAIAMKRWVSGRTCQVSFLRVVFTMSYNPHWREQTKAIWCKFWFSLCFSTLCYIHWQTILINR